MHALVVVLLPVASCEATGLSASDARRVSPHSLRTRSRARRPFPAVALLPLLACLTACTANDAAASQFLVVKLPASVGVLVLAALGCFLAGFGLGLVVALRFLRAVNTAASEYHRAQVARLLGASSSVHASVQEVLAIVHRRTQELQRLVTMLQRGGAQ